MKTIKAIIYFFFILLSFYFAKGTYALTCNDQADGAWGSAATWDCGVVPNSDDDVIIDSHIVTIGANQSAKSVTISGGTLNMGSYTLTDYGNWIYSSGTLNVDTSTLYFNIATRTFTPGDVDYYNVTFYNGNTKVITLTDDVNILNNFTIETYGNNFVITGAALNIYGDFYYLGANAVLGGFDLNFLGDKEQYVYGNPDNSYVRYIVADVVVNKPSNILHLYNTFYIMDSDWTWTSGLLDAATSTLRISGEAGNFYFTPGNVEYYNVETYPKGAGVSEVSLMGDLVVTNKLFVNAYYSTKGLVTNNHDVYVKDVEIDSTGELEAGSSNIKITGDFTNNNNFIYGTSIVAFQGTNQTITGNTTFYKLYKLVNEADTLYIASSTNVTIAAGGVARLWGKPEGKTLSIRSTEDGSPYTITKTGSIEAEYIDIKDATFSAAVTAAAANDSGGNTNLTTTKEFICTLRATGGDYTSLTSWEAAIETDLTAATTKVFSHSGLIGIIPDASTVEGLTSGATGTAIHVTDTQILIEGITGTFLSGEQVRIDGSNYVIITDAGFGAIATVYAYNDWPSGLEDTASVGGWTTGANNFISIYVPRSERHNGTVYNDDGSYTGFAMVNDIEDYSTMYVGQNYVRIVGVILNHDFSDSATMALRFGSDYGKADSIIAINSGGKGVSVGGVLWNVPAYLSNSIIYGGLADGILYRYMGRIYNSTIVGNSESGLEKDGIGVSYIKNILSTGNTDGDFLNSGAGTLYIYNSASSDDTADNYSGSGNRINQTFLFTDENKNDFHLRGGDIGARNHGMDLSVDPEYPIISDIDGDSRLGLGPNGWDIGADEYIQEDYAVTFGSTTVDKHNPPIAYWKFDEGYGATVHDFSGNGYNGTASSSDSGDNTSVTEMWDLNGKYNRAMEFDGEDDYVEISDNDIFSFTAGGGDDLPFSIGLWVKHSDDGDALYTPTFISKSNGVNYEWEFGTSVDGLLRFIVIDSTTDWIGRSCSYDYLQEFSNKWIYLSATYDGSNDPSGIKIYLNGKRIDDTDDNKDSYVGMSNLSIPVIVSSEYSFYSVNGSIDDMKIFDYALTEDDIKQEYNQGMAVVLGSTGTDSSGNADNSANRKYCVPGDTDTCNPPVLELNFDEKQGTTAYDTSGNGNNGTITGATWTRGERGSALYFDGSNDRVLVGNIGYLDNITVSAWVKRTNQGNEVIVTKTNTNFEWELQYLSNGYVYFVINGNSAGDSFGIDEKWHYLVGTYDGQSIKIYCDGRLRTSNDYSGSIDNYDTDVVIGERASGSRDFTGYIDGVKVYAYARTPAQIAWDYNKGKAVAEWRFDECTGTTIHDESGNGKDGTITIGAGGSQTSAGTCSNGTTAYAWYNGYNGKINKSLSFDGADDYVTVTQGTAINLTSKTGYSISSWFYANSDGEGNLGQVWSKGTNNYLRVKNESGNYLDIEANIDLATTDANLTIASAIEKDTWNQVLITYEDDSDDEISVYINGLLRGTSSTGDGSPATDSNNLLIGGSSGANFDGQIDETKIWNYALTAEQVKTEYNNGVVKF